MDRKGILRWFHQASKDPIQVIARRNIHDIKAYSIEVRNTDDIILVREALNTVKTEYDGAHILIGLHDEVDFLIWTPDIKEFVRELQNNCLILFKFDEAIEGLC